VKAYLEANIREAGQEKGRLEVRIGEPQDTMMQLQYQHTAVVAQGLAFKEVLDELNKKEAERTAPE